MASRGSVEPSTGFRLAAPDDGEASAPVLPIDSFVVRGHDFVVRTGQDIYAMPAAHSHSQIELNYMLAGSVTYLYGGCEAKLGVGDLALFWGAVAHRTLRVAPRSRYVCIYLPLEMFLNATLSETLRSAALAGGFLVASEPNRFDPARFQRLADDMRERSVPRVGELLAAEVLLALRWLDATGWHDRLAGRHPERRTTSRVMPAKVLEMMDFIAANSHRPISVGDVARTVSFHPNYAMTLFRTSLGLTIQSYILRHRLTAAQSLVIATKKDLTAIAFEVGFGSVSQFHRSFRAHFGCSPSEYRHRLQPATAVRGS